MRDGCDGSRFAMRKVQADAEAAIVAGGVDGHQNGLSGRAVGLVDCEEVGWHVCVAEDRKVESSGEGTIGEGCSSDVEMGAEDAEER